MSIESMKSSSNLERGQRVPKKDSGISLRVISA